jgi:hypothetical protein
MVLVALLLATVTAFFAGLFPYPFGLIVLAVLITARLLR